MSILTAAVANLLVALATLATTWVVGNYVTSLWDDVRKRRELDLAALNELYAVYGELFSLVKLWTMRHRAPKYNFDLDDTARHTLVERAAAVEARLEALIVRFTTEHRLDAMERDLLGAFRQGCQCVRQSIASDISLEWHSDRAAGYLQLKALAAWASSTLLANYPKRTFWRRPAFGPSAEEASDALLQVTSNIYEHRWQMIPEAYGLVRGSPGIEELDARISRA